ncbi:cell division protein FtsQ/DivIB [Ectothiorhodospiraceae bacterium WFHF3C12]|nr:cell division protein FtsQ/DivIB [Ectothiorhodospiraceae bacterium WFHF3C12]
MSVAALNELPGAGSGVDATRRRPARWLVPAGLAMLLASGMLWLLDREHGEPLFPLRSVSLAGDFGHVSEADLRAAMAPHLNGGLLSLDVGRIRAAVEELAWVRRASVRRIWPHALAIHIEEQQPLARWGEAGLVNASGQLFTPTAMPEGLPRLAGPSQRREAVVGAYNALAPALEEYGLAIDALSVDARGAWTLKLAGGARIELGTHSLEARLGRYLGALPRLRRQAGRVPERVDLRYPNGFAIEWKATEQARKQEDNRAAQ